MRKNQRKPNLFQAFLPILMMIMLLGIGSLVLDVKIEILLLLTTLFSGLLATYLGYGWEEIIESITDKVSKTFPALVILLMVGFLIGSWMIGGTIPYLVTLGLELINPRFIIITSFLISAVVSLFTGTSWGSVSTVGVALISIAIKMNAPLEVVAGAIVSGAYFGDKMSPLSDTTNLASMVVGANIYDHIRHMVYTTGPAFIIAGIVYTYFGITTKSFDVPVSNTMSEVDQLFNIFSFHPLLLIPVVIVLYGSITKKPTVPVMFISGLIAMLNGIIFQGFDLKSVLNAGIIGVQPEMFNAIGININSFPNDIRELLIRGGMVSMLDTLLVALCAFSFAGVMSVTGSLEIVLRFLIQKVKTSAGLIFTTIISCFVTVGITSNGQISILIPGELFKDTYLKFGLKEINLSRTLEDSATVIEPLVPWTVAGMFMAETLGVKTLSYLPYAIVCYLGVVFALIWAFTGFGIAKIKEKSI